MNYTCVTGVDGVGKSTFVRDFKGNVLKVFVPQFHLSKPLQTATSERARELREVSRLIEDWSQACDRQGRREEKPYALFSGILLAGPVLRELSRIYGERAPFLLDRDPYFDPLIYFSAYANILKSEIATDSFCCLASDDSLRIRNALQNSTLAPPCTNLRSHLTWLLNYATQDKDQILIRLREILQLPWPTATQVLTLSPHALAHRLSLKHANQAAEHHEQLDWLVEAQERYRTIAPHLPWPVTIVQICTETRGNTGHPPA